MENVERRNFILNTAEGALFIAGSSFISSQTVLPALIVRLGGGNIAVASVSVIVWVGLFLPQIFAARHTQAQQWKKPWALKYGLLQRLMVPLIACAILILGPGNPGYGLFAFFLLFSGMQILMGITTPGWYDLFAKVTPLNKRGRLSGVRNSIGGASAFLCGILLTWLLGYFDFPVNYVLAFLCCAALQGISLIVQAQIVEQEPSVVVTPPSLSAYVEQLRSVLVNNREFRVFLWASVFLVLATMPIGFFTVYALKHFQATETIVGEFTLTLVSVQIISALVNGIVADRYGNKTALVFAATALLLASLWAMVAPTIAAFAIVFGFVGIFLGTELMARYNIAVEYGPPEQRSVYIGLMNTMLAPAYLCGLLGGWISDMFGYYAVFGLGAIASAIGIALMVFSVREPRRTRNAS